MGELFKRHAVTTLANDVVVDFGLALLAISATVIYEVCSVASVVGFLVLKAQGNNGGNDSHAFADTMELWFIVGYQVFGLATCLLLVFTFLEVVKSGYKAVFVCFVQVGISISWVVYWVWYSFILGVEHPHFGLYFLGLSEIHIYIYCSILFFLHE